MQLFYTTDIQNNIATLAAEEARHCVQVLRHREGDIINLIDGIGGLYEAEIISQTKKSVQLRILKKEETHTNRKAKLHIAIAPTKNISRLEWFLEKATEMGIDEITPILCARSERKIIKHERLFKIILSAAKQSKNIILPKLNALTPIKNVLTQAMEEQKFIAHCLEDDKSHLAEKYKTEKDVLILIGPEGDFLDKEIDTALANNFIPVTLGESRLRTETAGIGACSIANLANYMDAVKSI